MRTKHIFFVLLSALCLVTVWAQPFDSDIRQTADYKQGATWVPVLLRDNAAGYRTNLGISGNVLTYSTNGQVIANTGTNVLTFTNAIAFSTNSKSQTIDNLGLFSSSVSGKTDAGGLYDEANGETTLRILDSEVYLRPEASESFRSSLGFSTNLATLWTATNAATAQSAIFTATNSAPTNTNAPVPDAWINVTVGTNTYKLPLWQ